MGGSDVDSSTREKGTKQLPTKLFEHLEQLRQHDQLLQEAKRLLLRLTKVCTPVPPPVHQIHRVRQRNYHYARGQPSGTMSRAAKLGTCVHCTLSSPYYGLNQSGSSHLASSNRCSPASQYPRTAKNGVRNPAPYCLSVH